MPFELQKAFGRQSTLVSVEEVTSNMDESKDGSIVLAIAIPHSPKTSSITSSTPPRDTGFVAIKNLAAATLVSSVILGLPLAFGVFQNHYTNHTDFSNKEYSAWIGVLSSGSTYLGAPLITYICEKYSWNIRVYIWIGWIITIASLLLSAIRPSMASLVVLQGLVYGLGAILVDMPTLIVINTWFLKRRGMVYGLVFAGVDLFGVVWAFVINALLRRYGLQNTFLIMAVLIAVTTGPAIMLLTERQDSISEDLPFTPSQAENPDHKSHKSRRPYFHQPIFYVLAIANLLQSFAVDLPYIYLPSFTTSLGFSSSRAALILAFANLAQIAGEIIFGKLSDKISVHILVVVAAAGGSLTVFLLWGFATTYAHLIALAVLYGYFASGFTALWARMGTLFGEKDAQIIYSIMSAGRGAGTIASGPISSALIKHGPRLSGRYGGGQYFAVMVFIGSCMAGSAILGSTGLLASLIRRPVKANKKVKFVPEEGKA